MGTELQRRGYKTALPLWSGPANFDVPKLVQAIHEDYIKAGSEVITTNTFRTNIRAWKIVGRGKKAADATKIGIDLALSVAAKHPGVIVGGSISTVEDCYEPESTPANNELEDEHGAQVALFKDSGVDFLMIETLNTIRETEIIARHAHKAGLPIWISVVTNEAGDLLSGESITALVEAVSPYSPAVMGVNCRPPEVILAGAKKLAAAFSGDKLIYANGDGQPANDLGWQFYDRCSPEDYLTHAEEWIDLGFNIIGSCCGASPAHIKALKDRL